jgi:hypothetical protein
MEALLKIIGILGLFIILAFILALPTLWLWNFLMPVVFGLSKITFMQALAMNMLSGILFKTSSNFESEE